MTVENEAPDNCPVCGAPGECVFQGGLTSVFPQASYPSLGGLSLTHTWDTAGSKVKGSGMLVDEYKELYGRKSAVGRRPRENGFKSPFEKGGI